MRRNHSLSKSTTARVTISLSESSQAIEQTLMTLQEEQISSFGATQITLPISLTVTTSSLIITTSRSDKARLKIKLDTCKGEMNLIIDGQDKGYQIYDF